MFVHGLALASLVGCIKASTPAVEVNAAAPNANVVEKPDPPPEATPEPAGVQQQFVGIAQRAKMGPLIQTDDGYSVWVDLGNQLDWPDDVLGKRVSIQGRFETRSDLPVFEHNKGDPLRAGMPLPPGADLESARKRQVLIDVTWKPAEE